MKYAWDFKVVVDNFPLLLRGLVVTVELWAIAFAIGLSLGFVVSLARISSRAWFNTPAIAYVEVFRNTPVLVQLIWFYYAFPIVLGQQLSPFTAAALGLVLNTSAYCAEIFRSGIVSIARGRANYSAAGHEAHAACIHERGIELAKVTSLASRAASRRSSRCDR
jgi:polar amino acid transport system permease protein